MALCPSTQARDPSSDAGFWGEQGEGPVFQIPLPAPTAALLDPLPAAKPSYLHPQRYEISVTKDEAN